MYWHHITKFIRSLSQEIREIFHSDVSPRKIKNVKGLITPARAIQLWHKRYLERYPRPFTDNFNLDSLSYFNECVYLPWANEKRRHCDAFVKFANNNPSKAFYQVMRGRVLFA